MNSIIVSNNSQENIGSPFDSIRRYRSDGSEYWSARELMKILGYIKWQRFVECINQAAENIELAGIEWECHMLPLAVKASTKGLTGEDFELSRFACYHVALCGDNRKLEIKAAKQYFVVKIREAEELVPRLSEQLQILKLENENLQRKERLINLTNTLVGMHGSSLGLAIAGVNVGQTVETKIPVTEVLNPVTGDTQEFLDAKQLASEVQRRTGQKISNAEFIRKVRAANRDDLIVPVTRNATCEYIHPDSLNEAIDIVYGRVRQKLIGE
jgi:hypothetical protein